MMPVPGLSMRAAVQLEYSTKHDMHEEIISVHMHKQTCTHTNKHTNRHTHSGYTVYATHPLGISPTT